MNNAGNLQFQSSSNIQKVVFSNNDKGFISKVSDNVFEALQIKGNIKTKYNFNLSNYNNSTESGTITFTKNTSITPYSINLLNGDLTDFNDPDVSERPCCSRSEFKAWYKYFKAGLGNDPEVDVFCEMVNGLCELGAYVMSAWACCEFGNGPSKLTMLDFHTIQY